MRDLDRRGARGPSEQEESGRRVRRCGRQQIELLRQQVVVGGHEDLHSVRGKLAQDLGDDRGQLRIQVCFGLVPEQVALLHQRSVHHEPLEGRDLAQPLGHEVRLHARAVTRELDVEPVAGELGVPAERVAEPPRERLREGPPDATEARNPERDAGIVIGLVERDLAISIQRNEAGVHREDLSRRKIDGALRPPGLRYRHLPARRDPDGTARAQRVLDGDLGYDAARLATDEARDRIPIGGETRQRASRRARPQATSRYPPWHAGACPEPRRSPSWRGSSRCRSHR